MAVQGNATATAAQMKQQIHQLAAAAAAAASAYPAALAAQLAAASSGGFPQDFSASALAGSGGLLPYSTPQGRALPEHRSGACSTHSSAAPGCFFQLQQHAARPRLQTLLSALLACAPGSMTYSTAVNGFSGQQGMEASADAGHDYSRFSGRGRWGEVLTALSVLPSVFLQADMKFADPFIDAFAS